MKNKDLNKIQQHFQAKTHHNSEITEQYLETCFTILNAQRFKDAYAHQLDVHMSSAFLNGMYQDVAKE